MTNKNRIDKLIDKYYNKKNDKTGYSTLMEEIEGVLEGIRGYEYKRDLDSFEEGQSEDIAYHAGFGGVDPRIERNDSDEYNPADHSGLAGPASSGRVYLMPEEEQQKFSANGAIAALSGKQYEEKISQLFLSKGPKVEPPAGSAHLPDIVVHFPLRTIKIEVKNVKSGGSTSGLDFGQFKLVFDASQKKWFVGGANVNSDDTIFAKLFKKHLEAHLNSRIDQLSNMINIYGKLGDDKLLTGFRSLKGDPAIVGGFRDAIFGSEKELNIPVAPEEVANYYGKYDFIQVKSKGLFALGSNDSFSGLIIPKFSQSVSKSNLRFRIKYHGGKSDVKGYSFTVAIKLSLNKSIFDLEKESDLNTFISFFSQK